jgi:magnesium transporter
VIVDCAAYRDGARLETSHTDNVLERACAALGEGADFVWLGLHDPDEAEMTAIAEQLGLHPLVVEVAVERHQRPKIEHIDGWEVVVLKTLWYVDEDDAVETGEIKVLFDAHHVVTIRNGEGVGLSRARFEAEQHDSMLGHGPTAALFAVCDSVVDEYAAVAVELENDVVEVERSLFSPERSQDADRIYVLKREVLEVRRAVGPLREPLTRMITHGAASQVPGALPYFREVLEHLLRVHEAIDSLDRLLDAALDAHLARIQVQQNEDMRRISAVAALFLAPTLVAGIYGMNFEVIPELEWAYGYPFALTLMVTVVLVLWRLFKKSGWL